MSSFRQWLARALIAASLACAGCKGHGSQSGGGGGASGGGGSQSGGGGASGGGGVTGGSPCAGVPSGASPGDPWQRTRTAVDQPDDFAGEYQVHVVYVEPSDRTATKQLDVDGSLRRSITAWNAWLVDQTGGRRMRVDTCNGDIDVTFVKLATPYTEAEIGEGLTLTPHGPAFVRDRLAVALAPVLADSKKLYLVFWDGLAFARCGGAAYPPNLPGHVTAQYLGGIFAATYLTSGVQAGESQVTIFSSTELPLPAAPFAATLGTESVTVDSVATTTATLHDPLSAAHPAGETLRGSTTIPDCRSNSFSADGAQLNYWEFSSVHECMHPLGIVPADAPDFAELPVAAGHLSLSGPSGTRDLMYQGTMPWGCPQFPAAANAASSVCVLDPSHRNYFATDGGTSVNLAKSVFLEPAVPGAVSPPAW